MEVGTNIKKIRELKELTAEQIATELNISLSGYHKIERNETDISIKRLSEIAEVLKVDLGKILEFDSGRIFNFNNNQVGNIEKQEYHNNDEAWKELVVQLRSEIEFLRSKIGK